MFDLKDFGMNCMDYQMIKNLIWLLSRHYPERLGVCLIINAPTLFSGCWAVIRAWYVISRLIFRNQLKSIYNYRTKGNAILF